MDLNERIIKYIESHHPISYSKIVQVAAGKGFSETEVLQALDKVARNKSITTKVRKDEVWYDLITITPVTTPTYITYWRNNYPPMTPDNDGSGIDIDLSWMFLKTKDERDEYKAAAKGVPKHMLTTYGRS
jgi:hypothetical protein